MFYLWKDKSSTDKRVLTYITDYKTIDPKTKKTWIDGFWWTDVVLIKESKIKMDCIDAAHDLMIQK